MSLCTRALQPASRSVAAPITATANWVGGASEEEIYAAMRVILIATKLVAEPSGAVTLAAALFHAEEFPKARKVAIILSGGNLEPSLREKLDAEIAEAK